MQLSELIRVFTEHCHMEWAFGMTVAEMNLPPVCFQAEKNLQLINLLNSREQVGDFYKPKW